MATERGALQASHPFLLTPGAQSLVLPNEIVPACTRLYLGSAPTNNEQSLRLLQITHVLSLLDRPHEIPADPTVAHKLVRIADCQSAYMDGALMEALPFTAALEQPAGRLHVHSEAGVSRSTAVVIAALMFSSVRGRTWMAASSPPAAMYSWKIAGSSVVPGGKSARASEGAAGGDVTDVVDILKKYACV